MHELMELRFEQRESVLTCADHSSSPKLVAQELRLKLEVQLCISMPMLATD